MQLHAPARVASGCRAVTLLQHAWPANHPEDQLSRWKYLKGPKSEERTAKNGHHYRYQEGGIAYPDPTDRPSRTILTGEGGPTASRFKHIIKTDAGRYRRLTPIELERLNGFDDGWTNTGMPDAKRAFMMGNALVVGLIELVGRSLGGRGGRVS